MEESLIEMYLAGVSVRRVEDVTELLWGSRASASTVSNLNQKVYGKIEEYWRNADVPRVPQPALTQYPDEQHPRTAEPRDTQKDSCCRLLAETSSARI